MVTKAIHQCDFSRAMSVNHKSTTVVMNGTAWMIPLYQMMKVTAADGSISLVISNVIGHRISQKTRTTIMLTE